jgi:hypothetical protein
MAEDSEKQERQVYLFPGGVAGCSAGELSDAAVREKRAKVRSVPDW